MCLGRGQLAVEEPGGERPDHVHGEQHGAGAMVPRAGAEPHEHSEETRGKKAQERAPDHERQVGPHHVTTIGVAIQLLLLWIRGGIMAPPPEAGASGSPPPGRRSRPACLPGSLGCFIIGSMVEDESSERRRPPSPDENAGIQVLMPPNELRALDNWRQQQPDLPSRPEAVRRLVDKALAAAGQSGKEALGTGYIKGDQLTSENDGGASR